MVRCRQPSTFGLPCDLAIGHEGQCMIWVPHDEDWKADGGNESSSDHWRLEKDDCVTMTVWPKVSGGWVWEVWDTEHTCGGPTDDERQGCRPCYGYCEGTPDETGEEHSFAAAKRAAEMKARFM